VQNRDIDSEITGDSVLDQGGTMSKSGSEADDTVGVAKRVLVERPHSRRTLLAGAAVGLAGAAAAAVVSSKPAGADGPDVLLGNGPGSVGNDAGTNQTSLTSDSGAAPSFNFYNTSSDGTALYGQAVGGSGLTFGPTGVLGDTDSSYGVGVAGNSLYGTGVLGKSGAPSGFELPGSAVIGDSQDNAGVYGLSMNNVGVYGLSKSSNGITGATEGNGMAGVYGADLSSTGGYGVTGYSARAGGVGVLAENAVGPALKVSGTAMFSRSGVVSIAAGKTSLIHTGVTLASTSLVLANLQNSLPGVYVEAVVPNVSGHSFQIVLSKAVPAGKTAKVAWFIVN
jgi:hypothetical protein